MKLTAQKALPPPANLMITRPIASIMKLAADFEIHNAANLMIDWDSGGKRTRVGLR
ncbi:hypothetical protein [Micromonospora tulbaghiae]|uniref:hypothetical protein n=1 Tax=Micromonospora tulbaghiae TaxID=479978 RepID=UPI0033C60B90